MIIYEDTRQQAGKHTVKHKWFEAHGIELVRRKLNFGDYAADHSNVIVDTKKDLLELAGNLGKDHERFSRECIRAYEHGYQLTILVETGQYSSIPEVAGWINTNCRRCMYYRNGMCKIIHERCLKWNRHPMTGDTLSRTMATFQEHYWWVKFEFAHPLHSAARICELLGVEYE